MAAAAASCLTLPCKSKPFSSSSLLSNNNRYAAVPLRCPPAFPSLTFSSSFSLAPFPAGAGFLSAVEKPRRRSAVVVCEVASSSRQSDSVAKRARQNEKRRMRNKSRKSEVRTRMKKIFEALAKLRKKKGARAEELIPIEKLIAIAYSKIDKAVRVGLMHKHTGSRRKSRLARRKRDVAIHHGWYTRVPAA